VNSSNCVALAVKKQQLCIPRLIQGQTSIRPDAIAIRTIARQLTYRELDERANRFATSLLQVGVKPGTVIGVFMHRSPECLAALLGIWKAGAAYLALDQLSPPERLAFVLRDAEVPVLIAERSRASLLPPHASQVLYASDLMSGQFSKPEDPAFSTSPSDLAYVLYTSGSTGKPKGVEVCHGSLANVVESIAEELELQAGEVLLAHISPGFDVSNLEMYLPLISGGSVYIADAGRVGHGQRLIQALQDSGATTLLGTCTVWRLLLDAGWEGKPDLRAISGGEVLPLELAHALVRRTAAVWNHYGPTEATICTTTARIDSTTEKISIGRPISNATVHVLNSNLQPVAEETSGELYIGGAGVARGYRNRQDLTTASFLNDPFSFEPDARMYKTGDLVRRLRDGSLEFVGRIDNQVKINGYRIELEEIEEQLRQFPGVSAAAVAAIGRGQNDRRLVAWFEARQSIPSSAIREFLRRRLPAYMVPSEFRRLDSMPLSESGKIDRRVLDASLLGAYSETLIEHGTDVELRLRSIWEDLLQIRPVALTDSFFDLGGDSLLAALLVVQIETHLCAKITPDTLIECPNIKSLAARIVAKENTPWGGLVALRAQGSKPPLFIVHGLGGSTLLFRSLSAHFDRDQPVYGITLPSGVVRDRSEIEIKTLASKYVKEIRTISPSGPYYISGHSFGTLIAFEIAAQIAQSGERIGLLALIEGDRNLTKRVPAAFDQPATPAFALRRYQAKLKSLTEKGVAEVFRRRVEHIKLHRRVKLAEKAVEGRLSEADFDAKTLMVLAGRDYKPSFYAGEVVLFRAKDEVRREADRDLGWAEIVGEGLRIVDIPGGHLTIFDEPNVKILAAALSERLSRGAQIGSSALSAQGSESIVKMVADLGVNLAGIDVVRAAKSVAGIQQVARVGNVDGID
jgi:amino acid adenylation domain-containing protein